MKRDAKDTLEQALDEEEFHVEDVRGKLFVGNRCGLNLASFTIRICALKDEVASQEEKVTSHEAEIAELKDCVLTLRLSLKEYRQVRNRFISRFKCYKRNNADGLDIKIIQGGNLMVHGGNAVVDTMLCQGRDGRCDFSAFKKLYGFDPLIVLRITQADYRGHEHLCQHCFVVV